MSKKTPEELGREFDEITKGFGEGSSASPLVDPKTCTVDDLESIIATDPTCSPEYAKELERRKSRTAEVEHWENKFQG